MTALEFPTPDPRTFDDATRPFAEALSSRYAIKRLIGSGGMGMVFLARDRRLDRLVAIKTLPPHLAKDPAIRERFVRETRTAGGMSHPGIVPIHGADEIDGHVFFVMSFVDGDSLASRVRAQGQKGLSAPSVHRYLRDVAGALAHAHQRGIIHRDIKAENILIERETDRALVTDFGIARAAEATPLTVTGQVLGSVHYVSPEQVSGSHVDARSDLYSLGVVGWFALTGSFPFDAEVASAVLVAHVTRPAPPVGTVQRGVPAALAAIVDRCLQKDPAHRFASAEELLAALDAAAPSLDRPPAIVTNTEAHAVWQRAAELEASTGLQPRPEPVARPRDESKARSRTTGYGVEEVISAAAEAGIDGRYVEHALVEHGLVPGRGVPAPQPTPPAPALAVRTPERTSWWTRVPMRTVLETEIAGELPPGQVEGLLHVLYDESGRIGTTLAKTRELAWVSGGWWSVVDVSVVPRQTHTAIRLVRSLRRRTMLLFVASSLAVGFISGMIIGAILVEGMGTDEFGAMVGVGAGLFIAFKSLRTLAKRDHRGTVERLRALAERLTRKVRASIG